MFTRIRHWLATPIKPRTRGKLIIGVTLNSVAQYKIRQQRDAARRDVEHRLTDIELVLAATDTSQRRAASDRIESRVSR